MFDLGGAGLSGGRVCTGSNYDSDSDTAPHSNADALADANRYIHAASNLDPNPNPIWPCRWIIAA
jgi:hypothetical protein